MLEPVLSDAILGVVVGSLLGFGGSYLSTRLQLRHDAEQRDIERKMQLRRDVFIEAAEGVAGTAELFLRLANFNVPVADLGDRNGARPTWLNKLYVVASPRTIEAFSLASLRIGGVAFDLLRQRLKLENIEARLKENTREHEALLVVQQKLQVSAADILAQPSSPEVAQRAAEVDSRWNAAVARQGELQAAKTNLWEQKTRLMRDLLVAAIRELGNSQQLVRGALVAMRSELGFASDEAILDTAAAVDGEMGARFTRLLDAIDADIDADAAASGHHTFGVQG